MTMKRRTFLFGATALGLSACAGAPPKESALDAAMRSDVRITDVVIDVAKMGDKTTGRPVPASDVNAVMQQVADGQLKGLGTGRRAVRVKIDVTSVNVINATQSILVGGESVMRGTLTLVDTQSGEVVLPATVVTSGGGGWVSGGLIAVATREQASTELVQMSHEFVARSRTLVFG